MYVHHPADHGLVVKVVVAESDHHGQVGPVGQERGQLAHFPVGPLKLLPAGIEQGLVRNKIHGDAEGSPTPQVFSRGVVLQEVFTVERVQGYSLVAPRWKGRL